MYSLLCSVRVEVGARQSVQITWVNGEGVYNLLLDVRVEVGAMQSVQITWVNGEGCTTCC